MSPTEELVTSGLSHPSPQPLLRSHSRPNSTQVATGRSRNTGQLSVRLHTAGIAPPSVSTHMNQGTGTSTTLLTRTDTNSC